MRHWWVNQNQTFRQEIAGGYLWSPKRNRNGQRNPYYEFMREVAPGDIVFSFCDTRIAALGIVSGYCRESPKPEEFGNAGTNWSRIGWRVRRRRARPMSATKSARPSATPRRRNGTSTNGNVAWRSTSRPMSRFGRQRGPH